MLVLSRKPGEKIVLGSDIIVTVVEVTGGRVRLGFSAPEDVCILRGELACWHDAGENRSQSPDAGCSPTSDTRSAATSDR